MPDTKNYFQNDSQDKHTYPFSNIVRSCASGSNIGRKKVQVPLKK